MPRELTRRQVEELAEQRAWAILDRIDAGPEPDAVPIAWYPTPEDYAAVLPEPGWGYEDWAAVTEEVIVLLDGHGVPVERLELRAAPYLSWLDRHGLENAPQNRAAYIAETRPGPGRR